MKRVSIVLAALMLVGVAVQPAAAERFFIAEMTGDQEVPPVETTSNGTSFFRFILFDLALVSWRVNRDFDQEVEDAHIHQGPPGQNGPIVIDYFDALHLEFFNFAFYLNFSRDLTGPLEGQTLKDLREEMIAGNTYINLHSEENPGGFVRGQIEKP